MTRIESVFVQERDLITEEFEDLHEFIGVLDLKAVLGVDEPQGHVDILSLGFIQSADDSVDVFEGDVAEDGSPVGH